MFKVSNIKLDYEESYERLNRYEEIEREVFDIFSTENSYLIIWMSNFQKSD